MLGDKMNTYDIIRVITSINPTVYANIHGDTVSGTLMAYPYQSGTIVIVSATGLPITGCNQGIHALHIHEGDSCATVDGVPFGKTGGHFNLTTCQHPYHTGDMPPLFSSDGKAWMAFYTDKFKPEQIIGRTVIIHQNVDDFTTQPAGNAGNKIACGEIIQLY